MMESPQAPLVKRLGVQEYQYVWSQMRAFTDKRSNDQQDEMWLVEHPPVFTQGQAGKPEHVLDQGNIPIVQSDRGGQVTFHSPGQMIAYPLLNLKRWGLGVRTLVTLIEQSVIDLLSSYGVDSAPRRDAPGVYVEGRKIASLGLRVRHGCSYHGVAVNITNNLAPFSQINPCGYAGMEIVRLQDLVQDQPCPSVEVFGEQYVQIFIQALLAGPRTDNVSVQCGSSI